MLARYLTKDGIPFIEFFQCSVCSRVVFYNSYEVLGKLSRDYEVRYYDLEHKPGYCGDCDTPFFKPEVWDMIQVTANRLTPDDIAELADIRVSGNT